MVIAIPYQNCTLCADSSVASMLLAPYIFFAVFLDIYGGVRNVSQNFCALNLVIIFFLRCTKNKRVRTTFKRNMRCVEKLPIASYAEIHLQYMCDCSIKTMQKFNEFYIREILTIILGMNNESKKIVNLILMYKTLLNYFFAI